MRRRLLPLSAAAALLLVSAVPAGAIVYGSPDTENQFANVGALIGEFDVDGEPMKFIVCTGTLVDPEVFLTAAHCLFAERMWVSFDSDLATVPPYGAVAASEPLIDGTTVAHPNAFCCGSNDSFDIGVVLLDDPVGIAPAPVVGPNAIGEMSSNELRSTTFTAVGYGAVRETRVTAWQALVDPEGVRSYATQSALSLTKAWLTLSMNQATGDGGTCYGDSGGPHFLPDGTIASITVTGDIFCKATDKTYRLDTPAAQEFLAEFLEG